MGVIRVFRGTAKAGREAELAAGIEKSVGWMSDLRSGFEEVHWGKSDDGRTFCVVSVWDDIESVKANMGEDLSKPKYPDDDGTQEDALESFTLEHFSDE